MPINHLLQMSAEIEWMSWKKNTGIFWVILTLFSDTKTLIQFKNGHAEIRVGVRNVKMKTQGYIDILLW